MTSLFIATVSTIIIMKTPSMRGSRLPRPQPCLYQDPAPIAAASCGLSMFHTHFFDCFFFTHKKHTQTGTCGPVAATHTVPARAFLVTHHILHKIQKLITPMSSLQEHYNRPHGFGRGQAQRFLQGRGGWVQLGTQQPHRCRGPRAVQMQRCARDHGQ